MNTFERLNRYLEGLPEGKPILRKSILDLGPPDEVDAALKTLVDDGTLMRATVGVFGKPQTSKFGKWIGFGAWEAAKAFCENEGQVMGLTPAELANGLHLSTQVVAKPTYITDGPTREVAFKEGPTLHFIHASPRDMRLTQTVGGGAVLGLEWVQPSYPLTAVRQLARDLSREHFLDFLQAAEGEGGWIGKAAHVYETVFGPDAPEDVLDLDREPDREGMNCGFADSFLEHDQQREAWTEGLTRLLASKTSAEKEGGHEA